MHRNAVTWGKYALLASMALAPAALTACGADSSSDGSIGEHTDAVGIVGSPTSPTSTVIDPGGGGYAPLPVWAPTLLGAVATSADTVTVSWTEHGGNGTTILQRQVYDLAGNASGGWTEVRRWTNLPQGARTSDDSNTTVAHKAGVAGSGGIILPLQPLQPDHQVGYRVVEIASGYADCQILPGGSSCANATALAYMPKATNFGVGRAQLRVRVASATSNASDSSLHVRAQLNPWYQTWLDSTQDDFKAGSNITYDLSTKFVDGLQDIQYIDLWTPDPDGICVSELALTIDDTPAFQQTLSTCVWVKNGSHLQIPFGTIRSSAQWQAYDPGIFANGNPPVTFIGYDSAALTAHLDSAVGTKLRDGYDESSGTASRLGTTTSIARTDATHLRVQQHLKGLHATWDGFDLGTLEANPSYDLVIHHADGTCTDGHDWCVKVENPDPGASYTGGALEWLLDLTSNVFDIVEYVVNNKLTDSLQSLTNLTTPPNTLAGYCFAPPTGTPTGTRPLLNGTTNHGPVTWDEGSLTLCIVQQ